MAMQKKIAVRSGLTLLCRLGSKVTILRSNNPLTLLRYRTIVCYQEWYIIIHGVWSTIFGIIIPVLGT